MAKISVMVHAHFTKTAGSAMAASPHFHDKKALQPTDQPVKT